jgi:hypothetical protein
MGAETPQGVFEDLLSCYRVASEAANAHPNDSVYQRELADRIELFRRRLREAIEVSAETVSSLLRLLEEITRLSSQPARGLFSTPNPQWTCPECRNEFSWADGTRTRTRNEHHHCPLPDSIVRLRNEKLERQLDAALSEKTEIKRATTKAVAEQCIVIATRLVSTPDGQRNLTWEEITHAIMRELLGWTGM